MERSTNLWMTVHKVVMLRMVQKCEIWGNCYSMQKYTYIWMADLYSRYCNLYSENLFSLINLITLDINHSNISEPIPQEIGDLINLTRLNLSNNLISGEIPSEIGSLNNCFTKP